MFDFVRANTRLFQFLLLILILPSFALVGMQGYTSMMNQSNSVVATVDGQKITQTEWDNALREQTNRVRAQNPNIDPKLFDTPEVKQQALDLLVRQHVIQTAATKAHLYVGDDQLNRVFWNDPQFELLRSDGKVNDAVLAARGQTFSMFSEQLRRDLINQQVTQPIQASALPAASNANLAFDAFLQQRSIRVQRFAAKDFAGKIEPSDAEIEAFYKDSANADKFKLPESAQIQYVLLDLDSLKKDVTVNEDDLKKYYDENASRFNVAEQRRASHILIKAPKDAPAADRAKAKARAEELLAQARKNPAGFADLAKKNSQDEGSAANGGDLDFFAHNGTMVKPFEDATFAMKAQGEVSNVVESDFGYHIIQLTGIRGGDKKSFAEVRPEIEAEVRKQLAQKRFGEVVEQFGNMVYEQADSLQPVADKLKLPIQTATVTRTPAPGAAGPLASPKLLEAVFANDALQAKHNTNAVEAGPNQLVSARVVQYNAARVPALADVKPKVREMLVAKLAAAQAVKAGQERLAALQKGGASADGLEPAITVSRAKPADLPRKALDGVLAADASKLPAYVGVDNGDGTFLVAQIDKIEARDPALIDPKRAEQQYAQAWATAETLAYYNALKARFKTTIKAAAAASAPAP
ncbi:SurA N-terminal domain-containing protein [Pelomonas sp. KK5]|uniref:SurA N-terminal domain-containing protein n=1 Tax=Pelomonas sp. KK5 TaxID=1855730 RepID=UPI00097C51EE|nr:SurA N-terminal domain-containing protein [Pelomonas sp. KK5]